MSKRMVNETINSACFSVINEPLENQEMEIKYQVKYNHRYVKEFMSAESFELLIRTKLKLIMTDIY